MLNPWQAPLRKGPRSRRAARFKTPGSEVAQQGPPAETGFTLIELLIVIAFCLIMASFAAPIYSRIVTRSHAAVLKDDLFTLREMINRYTLDNHKPPESLRELVKAGYVSGGLTALTRSKCCEAPGTPRIEPPAKSMGRAKTRFTKITRARG